jgi:hypothetical protein
VRFLKRFEPTLADLLRFEQEFRRFSQGSDSVSDFVERIDRDRDFLASHDRKLGDVTVRNIFIAGLRKSISSHVASVLTLKPDADYEVCDEIANYHPEVDSRGGSGNPRMQGLGRDKPRSGKYCAYRKVTTHDTDSFNVVKRLKVEGHGKKKPAK